MELRHLRYFVAVAEELHFARAAARLGIEQPPLSRQIRDLEEHIGVQLLHRTSRATWLSVAGEQFLRDARRILLDLDTSITGLRSPGEDIVRMGFAEGLAGMPFGDMLRAATVSHPNLRIRLVERNLGEMVRMLGLGAIDAILAPEQAATVDTDSSLAWQERLAVILPKSCGDDNRPIRLASIDVPFVLPDPEHLPGLSHQIGALLTSTQRQRASGSRFASLAMIYAMVASGHCAGLLPQSLAVASDWNVMRPIRDTKATISVWLTERRGESLASLEVVKSLLSNNSGYDLLRGGDDGP
ncbi:D-alanyl-D-alanine endopeptidase [Sphingobium sp. C100]|uniref:LysR family transcriptional regulator n=1 Tax=Sphingobium sp. C100 TaxID=1207055 RepID=UPI0003D6211C|nr:LysR family transcriptional regulator [Sphingobium sp. C100]ETI64274.1 D-alanyl-D-alanine endopeptidase [Sphingobium sp. C100]